MKNRREIKFRADGAGLVGRQNGIFFRIYEVPATDRTLPYIVSAHSAAAPAAGFTTNGHRYFSLDGAKEFCQQIASGEIDLGKLLMEFAAEDQAEEKAVTQEMATQARKGQSIGATITLTIEQAIAVQSAITTKLYCLREDQDRQKKIGGLEECIKFEEKEIHDLESVKSILREAIVLKS